MLFWKWRYPARTQDLASQLDGLRESCLAYLLGCNDLMQKKKIRLQSFGLESGRS